MSPAATNVFETASMQIAWLKAELCAALEKESAASIRADELEAALVQVADKRHLDETKRSLQAQVGL